MFKTNTSGDSSYTAALKESHPTNFQSFLISLFSRYLTKIKAQKSMYQPLPNLQNPQPRLRASFINQNSFILHTPLSSKKSCDIHLKHVISVESGLGWYPAMKLHQISVWFFKYQNFTLSRDFLMNLYTADIWLLFTQHARQLGRLNSRQKEMSYDIRGDYPVSRA